MLGSVPYDCRMARIFVSGTWRPDRAEPHRADALRLGARIAARGFDLVCGPGTGIARHVIDGYRSVQPRGLVRYVLPRRELMDEVGEIAEPGHDELEQTEFDYPMRNVWQVSQCDGLVVLTGGDGALEEILPALIDYQIPVGIVRESGPAAIAVARLLDLFPEWSELTVFGDSATDLIDELLDRVALGKKPGG